VHTYEQFLQLTVGLGLCLLFVCFFSILSLCCFIALNVVSSILSQEIGWEERLRNDLVCDEWDVKP